MAYHDDLLRQAYRLLGEETEPATQADLRRAVSAAYYALFHLLIAETVANWWRVSSRDGMARMFEHRVMAKASDKTADSRALPFTGEDSEVVTKLRTVARALFVDLQQSRHVADYDNATIWNYRDARDEIAVAKKAFTAWESIRNEPIAQDYLVSLLIKPRA